MDKIVGFDFIRSFAILFVFIAHILNKQSENSIILLVERSISPGLTMSVLGFISAYLLTSKYKEFNGFFYVKRFSKIYSSLVVCLSFVTVLHLFLSYNVFNQHSIIHFMGLSFFMGLFQVTNKSSLGEGLWFVTIINIMYLLLPLMSQLYTHKYKKIHLLLVICCCLFFSKIMYGVASSWNVAMSFNIGCFIRLNSNIRDFFNKSIFYYVLATCVLLVISALATSRIIPYEIRDLLLPLYPFCAIPVLYNIGNKITGVFRSSIVWFSSISYEVYILHFYFINEKFSDLFPSVKSIWLQILLAMIIVLPLASLLSKAGVYISKSINTYMLSESRSNDRVAGDISPRY